LLAIAAAYYLTLFFRVSSAFGESVFATVNRLLGVRESGVVGPQFLEFYVASAPRILFFLTVTICGLYALLDLYPGRRFIRRRPVAWNVMLANFGALVVFYIYFYLRRNVFHPRSFFATALFLNVLLCIGLRGLVARGLAWLREHVGYDTCPAVLIGTRETAGFLDVLIEELHPHGISIVDRVAPQEGEPFESLVKRAEDSVRQHGASMLISAENDFTVKDIMRLLELTETLGIPVKVLSEHLGVLPNKANVPVDSVRGIPLVHFEASAGTVARSKLRRPAELALAAVLTLLTLPLTLVSALLVRVTSPGGVFFTQERIGVNRRPFRMVKLRTMYHRSDEVQAELEELNESGEGLFKVRKDPRVTPVGRFLRRFSIDELPQLLNVLKGEMTLVGPRPLPRRDFENYYEDWHYSRHAGLPGLTCLWQVSGRSEIDFHNMCILDVYYLRNQSWVLDVKIILKTFWVVLFARGAY
jgi:exopolysaccharide biosynthesis polyprenyl glycosylphosphotransferase